DRRRVRVGRRAADHRARGGCGGARHRRARAAGAAALAGGGGAGRGDLRVRRGRGGLGGPAHVLSRPGQPCAASARRVWARIRSAIPPRIAESSEPRSTPTRAWLPSTDAGSKASWAMSSETVKPTRSEEHTSELQSREKLVC